MPSLPFPLLIKIHQPILSACGEKYLGLTAPRWGLSLRKKFSAVINIPNPLLGEFLETLRNRTSK